jgi:hypothetical protein
MDSFITGYKKLNLPFIIPEGEPDGNTNTPGHTRIE